MHSSLGIVVSQVRRGVLQAMEPGLRDGWGRVKAGSQEEAVVYRSQLEEAVLLLSPGARHDNIVRLLGVVLDVGRVRQLVFELADEGTIENHIRRLLTSSDNR